MVLPPGLMIPSWPHDSRKLQPKRETYRWSNLLLIFYILGWDMFTDVQICIVLKWINKPRLKKAFSNAKNKKDSICQWSSGQTLWHQEKLIKGRLFLKCALLGLPWWSTGKTPSSQCRGPGFDPWSRKIPRATQKLSWHTTAVEPCSLDPWNCSSTPGSRRWDYWSPHIPEPVFHGKRSHCDEKPEHPN